MDQFQNCTFENCKFFINTDADGKKTVSVVADSTQDEDLASAVGLVLCMEFERMSVRDQQRVTMKQDIQERSSVWRAAGTLRSLNSRSLSRRIK